MDCKYHHACQQSPENLSFVRGAIDALRSMINTYKSQDQYTKLGLSIQTLPVNKYW